MVLKKNMKIRKPKKRYDGIWQRYWILKKIYKNPILTNEELENQINQKILEEFSEQIREKEKEWENDEGEIPEKFKVLTGELNEQEGKKAYLENYISDLKIKFGKPIRTQLMMEQKSLEGSIKKKAIKERKLKELGITIPEETKRIRRTKLEILRHDDIKKQNEIKLEEKRLEESIKKRNEQLQKIRKTKKQIMSELRKKIKIQAIQTPIPTNKQYLREKIRREERRRFLEISKIPELSLIKSLSKASAEKEKKKRLTSNNQIFIP